MSQQIKFRFALPLIAIGVSIGAYCAPASAQDSQDQQTQSVADAARQARAAKKNAKSTKVISDDDLDKSGNKPGGEGLNVGSAPTSDSQAPNAAAVNTDLKADQAAVAAETTAVVKPGEDRRDRSGERRTRRGCCKARYSETRECTRPGHLLFQARL